MDFDEVDSPYGAAADPVCRLTDIKLSDEARAKARGDSAIANG